MAAPPTDSQCARSALELAGAPRELLEGLLRYATAPHPCHPCSMQLVSRAARETVHAAAGGQWAVAAGKLAALLLLLSEGAAAVFAENLVALPSGVIACRTAQDHLRFQGCCTWTVGHAP